MKKQKSLPAKNLAKNKALVDEDGVQKQASHGRIIGLVYCGYGRGDNILLLKR